METLQNSGTVTNVKNLSHSLADTIIEKLWLRIAKYHVSYNTALAMLNNGTMSAKDFNIFCFFWDWSTIHLSRNARQDHVFNKYGWCMVVERVNRIRRIMQFAPL